jgi:hypothetical protein
LILFSSEVSGAETVMIIDLRDVSTLHRYLQVKRIDGET